MCCYVLSINCTQSTYYTTLCSVASCHVSLHVLALCAGTRCEEGPFIQIVPSEAPSLRLYLPSSDSAFLITSDGNSEEDRTGAGKGGRPCSLLSLLVILSVRNSANSVLRSAALRGGFYEA